MIRIKAHYTYFLPHDARSAKFGIAIIYCFPSVRLHCWWFMVI